MARKRDILAGWERKPRNNLDVDGAFGKFTRSFRLSQDAISMEI